MHETPLKIKFRPLRLNSDQAERILTIHRSKAVECYEYWDFRLRDLGLVAIGPIPPEIKTAKEKLLAATWVKVRTLAGIKTPGLAKIREIEGLMNQMNNTVYRMDRKYSTLTKAGAELATSGRAIVRPGDVPKAVED